MYRKFFGSILLLMPFVALFGCNMERYSVSMRDTVPAIQEEATKESIMKESVRFTVDYREGLTRARREAKPILVCFTLPDCNTSRRMFETTFQDAEIKRLANRFVCVAIDGFAEPELCESFQVKGFPTILILNSSGVELQRLSGTQSSEQLSLPMHVAIQSLATKIGSTNRK